MGINQRLYYRGREEKHKASGRERRANETIRGGLQTCGFLFFCLGQCEQIMPSEATRRKRAEAKAAREAEEAALRERLAAAVATVAQKAAAAAQPPPPPSELPPPSSMADVVHMELDSSTLALVNPSTQEETVDASPRKLLQPSTSALSPSGTNQLHKLKDSTPTLHIIKVNTQFQLPLGTPGPTLIL